MSAVLKESNKSNFYSYSVRKSGLSIILSHITFQGCRVHIFSDNLSRNSCIFQFLPTIVIMDTKTIF